jgi:predicted lysophospholipase L1 biosynthesis ABC-type transport system permease subunit
MAVPIATLLAAAMLAAIPPVLRAMRIDSTALLRSE